MANITKNILTREFCKTELKKPVQMHLIKTSILMVPYTLVFGLLLIIGIESMGIMKALPLVITAILGFCILVFIGALDVMKMRSLDRGDFRIVTDKVRGLAEGENVRRLTYKNVSRFLLGKRRMPIYIADVIYFGEHEMFIPSRTVFELSSVDDEFYIVVLNKQPRVPKLVFSTKMYECKELG